MTTRQLMIKVCGMRDRENIRDLLQLGPDMMGLIFYPGSKRYVQAGPELLRDLTPDLTTKPTLLTGVFVDASVAGVLDKVNYFKLAAAQLHGSEPPTYCRQLKTELAEAGAAEVRLIKAFGISEDFDWSQLQDYRDTVDYFLFDTRSAQHGGTGRKFDWGLLNNYSLSIPYLLSGGINEEDVAQLLALADRDTHLVGVDLNSRFEISPGWKNMEQLEKTINLLRDGRSSELPR